MAATINNNGSPGEDVFTWSEATNKQLKQGGFDLKGTTRQALSKVEVSARTGLW